MRRIDESIESLTPMSQSDNAAVAPLAFRWRGRRYVVGTVLAHWVETGAWWRRVAPHPQREEPHSTTSGPPDPERWIWRVEACRGAQTGVFDLCLEVDHLVDVGPTEAPAPERWSLHAIYD
ncbi:MAG: DUF6504 family protein [Actinomycetes bacterium]|jgi:hypothetical protein